MQVNIVIAQLKPKKGNYTANLARLAEVFGQLRATQPATDVLVLPETFMNGYFLEGGVREGAHTAGDLYQELQATYLETCGTDAPPLDISVGFYERFRDRLYNSALYATLGSETPGIRHVHRKVFLPTYGVFDEGRFVESGRHIGSFETRYGRAAMLICEDAWHSSSSLIAALGGAQVIFIHSASPARGTSGERPTNVTYWENLARSAAEEHGVYTVVAQLVGFEGGKGFSGGSMVRGPRGEPVVYGPLWDEALVQATLDLDQVSFARADTPLLADVETMLPHLQSELDRILQDRAPFARWDGATENAERRAQSAEQIAAAGQQPSSPAGQQATIPLIGAPLPDISAINLLHINPEMVRQWLVTFLRDEVIRRRGFKDVVIALSGGVDSALAVYLCAEAFGPEHVLAVRMPYATSSPTSLEHAQMCIDALGIRSETVDITPMVDGYTQLDPGIDATRKGNVMARSRMIVLFDYSQKMRALPIGTGNKSERLFGYYTWHADDSPPVNPLGDLFKTQVWQLARHIGVPSAIVDKPASADLVTGQTDEADFGISYTRADPILYFLLQGYAVEQLERLGFVRSEVEIVKKRVDSTHWKRRLPTVAMLSTTAIGEYYLRPVDY